MSDLFNATIALHPPWSITSHPKCRTKATTASEATHPINWSQLGTCSRAIQNMLLACPNRAPRIPPGERRGVPQGRLLNQFTSSLEGYKLNPAGESVF